MYDYSEIQSKYGRKVAQTIDSPITVFDFWELSDVFIGLFIILIFGVVAYSWITMSVLLLLFLVIGPVVKKKNHRGIYLHWPYRHLKMNLPGLINPGGRKRYSD